MSDTVFFMFAMSKLDNLLKCFSGKKRKRFFDEVPSLYQQCIMILQEHVDDIDEVPHCFSRGQSLGRDLSLSVDFSLSLDLSLSIYLSLSFDLSLSHDFVFAEF